MTPPANGKGILGGPTRETYGILVSVSSEDRKRFRTFHERGRDPLPVICAKIDALPGRWYVDAISDPDTIWQDLTRDELPRGDGFYRERIRLAHIGRLDLLRVPILYPPATKDERPGDTWRRLYGNGIKGGIRE